MLLLFCFVYFLALVLDHPDEYESGCSFSCGLHCSHLPHWVSTFLLPVSGCKESSFKPCSWSRFQVSLTWTVELFAIPVSCGIYQTLPFLPVTPSSQNLSSFSLKTAVREKAPFGVWFALPCFDCHVSLWPPLVICHHIDVF